MIGIESRRREVYEFPGSDYGNILEVGITFENSIERDKQHLIEEKIDRLFDEVKEILNWELEG